MAIRVVPGAGSGSDYIDSLIWGGRLWKPDDATKITTISYWFGDPGQEYNAAVAGRGGDNGFFGDMDNPIRQYWDNEIPAGREHESAVYSFLRAMQLFSSVCNLKFEQATSVTDADMVWWKTDLSQFGDGILGIHEGLGKTYSEGDPRNERTQVWGYFNPFTESWKEQNFGGDGLNTIIHEIGHGLGLAHPHDGGSQPDATTFPGVVDGNFGQYGLNQSVFSVMSYNSGLDGTPYTLAYGTQGGLGAFDIAALQVLYGVNKETNKEENTYVLPNQNAVGTGWFCIWDGGGDDMISGRNATGSITIDLRAATLNNNDPNAGGYLSVIENAEGGDFDDALIGNEAANRLQGYKGADLIAGWGGEDILDAGEGDDTLEGGAGADQLYGGEGTDLASYSQAAKGVKVDLEDTNQNTEDAIGDTFSSIEGVIGSDFDDTISGTSSAELFVGGSGKDILAGRGGDDVYIVEGDLDQVIEAIDGGYDTVITSKSASLTSFANCEALYAADGSTAINLGGTGGRDKLVGNGGTNILKGGGGVDTLQGGAGNDTFYMDATDEVSDTSGTDTAVVEFSYTLASFLENLIGSGTGAIRLTGNGLSNSITGNSGANRIKGEAGSDRLNGGLGNDLLYGGTGSDKFVFNTTLNARTNKDKIVDWNYKDDTIYLENAIFKSLKKTGALSSSSFVVASKAKDTNDYIGYNKATGDLWYDANGNKAGGQAAFANIGTSKAIYYKDFVII
jgi:serralysin